MLELDARQIPFGDSGSFKFRTRVHTATLLLIQFYSIYSNDTGSQVASLEFSLYNKNLQVTAKSNTGSNKDVVHMHNCDRNCLTSGGFRMFLKGRYRIS